MKKAQGLPFSVIVIAIIVLIVAVVVSLIFVKYVRESSSEFSSCALKGGTCAETCTDTQASFDNTDCSQRTDNMKLCCVQVLKNS